MKEAIEMWCREFIDVGDGNEKRLDKKKKDGAAGLRDLEKVYLCSRDRTSKTSY